jgi:transcriptional regulator with XRE-family HTH domain
MRKAYLPVNSNMQNDKLEYSSKIKKILIQNNLTIGELAEATGLRIETIKNILYGKSSKYQYIKQISDAMAIPIEFFTNESEDEINPDTFLSAVQLVHEFLKDNNVLISSKQQLIKLYDKVYFKLYNDRYKKEACILYLQGLVDGLIDTRA